MVEYSLNFGDGALIPIIDNRWQWADRIINELAVVRKKMEFHEK